MRHRTRAVIIMGLFTLLFAGCSPTLDSARAQLEMRAADMDTAGQDVLQAADAAGFPDATAKGRIESCGGSLKPGMAYRVGGTVPVGDDLAGAVAAISDQLRSIGWNHEGTIGEDPLSSRFTRDDIMIDLKAGGASVGGTKYGADEMQIGITQANPCVRVPESTYTDEFQDFEKDILPRS